MLGRMIRVAILGLLIGLVWTGYRRGAFKRENVRYGMDRLREGFRLAGDQARESFGVFRRRAGRTMRDVGDKARQTAMEARSRVEHVIGS